MKHLLIAKFLGLTLVVGGLMEQTALANITIDFVQVGNAGSGAVGYTYGIGKYEVTLNQYAAFLNAVAAVDTYGLYRAKMTSDRNAAGIMRYGGIAGYTYEVIGSGNRPVAWVSWYDAARFVNWLQNGQPTGPQVAGITETGAYTLTGNTGIILRNANWTYGLPTEDEWYKAAAYDPTLNAGSGGYWLFPTRSNDIPNSRNGSLTDPNSANFFYDDGIANGYNGGYAVTGSKYSSTTQPYLTDVGAFRLARSYYGTFDQGGNVWEWNDGVIAFAPDGSLGRGLRGGSWADPWQVLPPSLGNGSYPDYENSIVGFRIVIVPEPSVVGILTLGIALLVWKRKRTSCPLVRFPDTPC